MGKSLSIEQTPISAYLDTSRPRPLTDFIQYFPVVRLVVNLHWNSDTVVNASWMKHYKKIGNIIYSNTPWKCHSQEDLQRKIEELNPWLGQYETKKLVQNMWESTKKEKEKIFLALPALLRPDGFHSVEIRETEQSCERKREWNWRLPGYAIPRFFTFDYGNFYVTEKDSAKTWLGVKEASEYAKEHWGSILSKELGNEFKGGSFLLDDENYLQDLTYFVHRIPRSFCKKVVSISQHHGYSRFSIFVWFTEQNKKRRLPGDGDYLIKQEDCMINEKIGLITASRILAHELSPHGFRSGYKAQDVAQQTGKALGSLSCPITGAHWKTPLDYAGDIPLTKTVLGYMESHHGQILVHADGPLNEEDIMPKKDLTGY